ncbi:glycosyl transferase, group 1 [Rubellimicrobium mesophilum DSM 19309]|uniref:Glycosyl transferase, group 1 n=1 Tax=Rubellimicrobium mesophilum DSM 19309 TaxID=442562 RepID=A0A017HRL9_9RHOB|nr:GNAT family N-acetyltransferase [Rubellimicrobium mesophilum]EYD76965.1 glycosyl transferase, group 1 [Rubellimicrobium mesophilum DSM 19309]
MPSSPELAVVPPSGLFCLEAEWDALWRRCPRATPFQSPAWLLPWARHYAPDRCGAVTLRASDQLVGLAPVFCWEGALLLAGTGPSDRGDALLDPAHASEAPRLLAALPQAAPEPFDRLDLQQLGEDSPLLCPAPEGWTEERPEADACLVAPLTGEDGLARASGRQRSHWRHALRQLDKLGGTTGLATPEEIPEAIEDLLRLNRLRWGEAGVLADPLMQAHLRDAAPALVRSGLLRLHQAILDGQRIAVLLVLAGPWAHHGYNGGFDPAHARLSPSAILVGLAMRQATREGVRHFDFLRGHEGYKRVWGAEPRPMHRRVLRPSP